MYKDWAHLPPSTCSCTSICLSIHPSIPCSFVYPSFYCVCMCVCVCVFSRAWLFATHQAPLSMGLPRQEYCSGLPFPPPGKSSWPRDQIGIPYVSCIAGGFFTTEPLKKPIHSFTDEHTKKYVTKLYASSVNYKSVWFDLRVFVFFSSFKFTLFLTKLYKVPKRNKVCKQICQDGK